MADLEKFFEKSMTEFLDSKMPKVVKKNIDREEDYGLYMSKDYIKEVDTALGNDELNKAKLLFEELKNKYATYNEPLGKKKIYSMLQDIHAKISKYVADKESLKNSDIQKYMMIQQMQKTLKDDDKKKESSGPRQDVSNENISNIPNIPIQARQQPVNINTQHTPPAVQKEPAQDISEKIDKKDVNTYYDKGVDLLSQKKYIEASRIFRKILDVDPAHRQSMIRLQQCRDAR